jgi:hypothetical protein
MSKTSSSEETKDQTATNNHIFDTWWLEFHGIDDDKLGERWKETIQRFKNARNETPRNMSHSSDITKYSIKFIYYCSVISLQNYYLSCAKCSRDSLDKQISLICEWDHENNLFEQTLYYSVFPSSMTLDHTLHCMAVFSLFVPCFPSPPLHSDSQLDFLAQSILDRQSKWLYQQLKITLAEKNMMKHTVSFVTLLLKQLYSCMSSTKIYHESTHYTLYLQLGTVLHPPLQDKHSSSIVSLFRCFECCSNNKNQSSSLLDSDSLFHLIFENTDELCRLNDLFIRTFCMLPIYGEKTAQFIQESWSDTAFIHPRELKMETLKEEFKSGKYKNHILLKFELLLPPQKNNCQLFFLDACKHISVQLPKALKPYASQIIIAYSIELEFHFV